jgi:putative DNA primase/helicase
MIGLGYWWHAVPRLRYWQKDFLEWRGKNWNVVDDDTMRNKLYTFLDAGECQVKGYKVRFQPQKEDVNKVLDALQSEANLPADVGMPGWLLGKAPVENLKEVIGVQNGLLDVPSRRLLKHTPLFWSRNVVEFDYDPKARAPRFEQFLHEIFPGDGEAQETLKEMIGLCLTDENKYQKAFMFVGPRRGGRGTIGRVFRGLVGEHNYVGPTIRGATKDFGTESWIGKKSFCSQM